MSAASEREALVQIMRDRDDMFVTFEMHADAILAAGFTRQSRAEIQAEDGLDKIADAAATNDGRVIVWAVNELTRAVRSVEAAIREGGDRG